MLETSAETFFKGKFLFTPSFLAHVCTHLTTCVHVHTCTA